MTSKKQLSKKYKWLIVIFFLLILSLMVSYSLYRILIHSYSTLLPKDIRDRNGLIIDRYVNNKNLYADYKKVLPQRLKNLLIKKEDNFFYYHIGVNPISIVRSIYMRSSYGKYGGASTITQQLVKVLLGNEKKRSFTNKIIELLYAISLELYAPKDTILTMYINTAYLGNQAQGFSEASDIYFNKQIKDLTEQEMVQLLATLASPSTQNPWKDKNIDMSIKLAKRLGVPFNISIDSRHKMKHSYRSKTFFEVSTLGIDCKESCMLTIDNTINEKIRDILNRNIGYSYKRGVHNAAAVVIKVPENEILAIVGSRNPFDTSDGAQINMAIKPRPVGSTIKPFIYANGFKAGLRPYTIVQDREYKYPIATGFPLYPKNYDGRYRGAVTLHEALSNSLNVPTVKVLEYVGLNEFYDFLESDLSFEPIQDLQSYQFGIALGGLEMDLLTLVYYFTVFPNDGVLKQLHIISSSETDFINTPQSHTDEEKHIFDRKYVQLVNKILNDRKSGVNQFGLESNLNIYQHNYAVKTGTSRDYHDSWTVGYTPDFVVGVWIGNDENTSLKQVSGQAGAGRIWHEIMELLLTTEYNKNTQFDFSEVSEEYINNSIEFGIKGDTNIDEYRNAMSDDILITHPHDRDIFEFSTTTVIPFKAQRDADWYVNGVIMGHGKVIDFKPDTSGTFDIEAIDKNGDSNNREIILIEVVGE